MITVSTYKGSIQAYQALHVIKNQECDINTHNTQHNNSIVVMACVSSPRTLRRAIIKNNHDLSYRCTICTFALWDAATTNPLECPHMFCLSCITDKRICGICHTDIVKPTVDYATQYVTETLQVYCGVCNWEGANGDYDEHLDHCKPSQVSTICKKDV